MNPYIALFLTPFGRIRRREFWLGFAVVVASSFVIGAIPAIGQSLGFVLLWPQVVIHVKRLHDFGWSGWILLVPFSLNVLTIALMLLSGGVPILTFSPGELPADFADPHLRVPMTFFVLTFAVEIATLLWIGLTRGDAQANRFGPAAAA